MAFSTQTVEKVLLCSLFDLLWEVLGAEKVLRRDVEEEEGPVTGIETKVVGSGSKAPPEKMQLRKWVIEFLKGDSMRVD